MKTNSEMHQITEHMQQCIENCQECHSICLNTAFCYCLQQGERHTQADNLRLMLDCAEICQTSANFMLRGSDLHVRTCGNSNSPTNSSRSR